MVRLGHTQVLKISYTFWLQVPAAGCDVMAIITYNYNPEYTSALMVRVYCTVHQ